MSHADTGTVRPSPLRGRRLLVVDSSPIQREAVRAAAAREGLDARVVADAATAERELAESVAFGEPFDTVVLATRLNDVGPSDLLATVRRLNAACPDGKIVLATPRIESHGTSDEQAAGVVGCVERPIRPSRYFDELTRALLGHADAATAPAAAGPVPTRSARLLLAEDHPVNQLVATQLLENAGFTVDVVADGRAAVVAARGSAYDLVLMDCQMPEMDGYEATRELRRLQATGGLATGTPDPLPIVALTANAVKGDRDRCLAAGMDEHVAKPLRPATLFETIDRLLARNPSRSEGPDAPKVAREPLPVMPDTPEVSPIDHADLLDRCGGDPAFVGKLLTLFQSELGRDLTTARAALGPPADREALRRVAHKIKGAAGNVAARPLHAAAVALEDVAERTESTETALLDALARISHEAARVGQDATAARRAA